ncbi:glucose-6-phosphate dehydrogenase [Actinocorallia aurantiaca]|uniref:Glucose-6-phosphate 1-dehydrogenase n=1 Tax=Actinocorallia aurantiaca TaxID=46204 RepID=A0ABP6GGS8_9ACTN
MTDTESRAEALVLYGITGDLARRMLLPALYRMVEQDVLDEPVIGVTRGDWTPERLHRHAHESIAAAGPVDEEVFSRLADLLKVASVDYDDSTTYARIVEQAPGSEHFAHYLAIPPAFFVSVAKGLAEAGLNENARFIVEKPFGHDLASARALQTELTRYFPEERIRRVDHFLGKDAVENLLVFRFANPIMNAVLDRAHVRGVQITMAEDLDVADRGSFYDSVGALRDVVQNHLFQVLAYFIMEAPRSGGTQDVLDEKARTLRAVRAVAPEDYVRGQYAGYRETEGVAPDSTTETYAALRVHVDTERWSSVPFSIRAGKNLAAHSLELIVELDRPPARLYRARGAEDPAPNLIRFRLNPRPGVTLDLLAEQAGTGVGRVSARLDLSPLSGEDVHAYVRILSGAITGDPRHFARMDVVEEFWRIVDGILAPATAPLPYRPGTWGPAEADALATGGRWLPLENAPAEPS